VEPGRQETSAPAQDSATAPDGRIFVDPIERTHERAKSSRFPETIRRDFRVADTERRRPAQRTTGSPQRELPVG